MVVVVSAREVALDPEFLDEDEGFPALKGAGAVFDALYNLIAWWCRFL